MTKNRFNLRSVVAIAVCLTATILAACSGSGSKQQSGTDETAQQQAAPAKSSSTNIEDVAEGNWKAVIKTNFGVDIVAPDGWSFKEVKSLNGKTNIKLFLNIGGSTTGEAFGKKLFEATKALSPHGNYKGSPNWDNDTVAAGDALTDFPNSGNPNNIISSWSFTFNSRMVILNYYAVGNVAEFTFTLN